ncbi:hypothetical protein Pcinc_014416 [Petrolisthes cinctipes]|uniref:BZIP domain-containing protein n=1 Tax=Petrolisthes cinctipes TaxID=88211 RepID=A0AAE1FV24_PETCI|nr:hypothetical protein Pcinc_014416 [Petrolisthes cinctipes]
MEQQQHLPYHLDLADIMGQVKHRATSSTTSVVASQSPRYHHQEGDDLSTLFKGNFETDPQIFNSTSDPDDVGLKSTYWTDMSLGTPTTSLGATSTLGAHTNLVATSITTPGLEFSHHPHHQGDTWMGGASLEVGVPLARGVRQQADSLLPRVSSSPLLNRNYTTAIDLTAIQLDPLDIERLPVEELAQLYGVPKDGLSREMFTENGGGGVSGDLSQAGQSGFTTQSRRPQRTKKNGGAKTKTNPQLFPVQNHYPMPDPVQSHYPLQDPVQSHYPLQDPVQSHYPLQDPVQSHYPLQDPVQSHYPLQDPVQSHYPLQDSVQSHYPLQDPVQSHYPLQDPVQYHYPMPDPVQNQYSMPDPVQRKSSMSDPLQKNYPMSDPVQSNFPLPNPVQNKYPMSDPLENHQHPCLANLSQEVKSNKMLVEGTKRKRHPRVSHATMTDEESRERNRILNNEASRYYREQRVQRQVTQEDVMAELTLKNQKLKGKVDGLQQLRDEMEKYTHAFFREHMGQGGVVMLQPHISPH